MPIYCSKLSKFSQNAISKQKTEKFEIKESADLLLHDFLCAMLSMFQIVSYTMHEAFGTLENVALKQETAFELPTRPF